MHRDVVSTDRSTFPLRIEQSYIYTLLISASYVVSLGLERNGLSNGLVSKATPTVSTVKPRGSILSLSDLHCRSIRTVGFVVNERRDPYLFVCCLESGTL